MSNSGLTIYAAGPIDLYSGGPNWRGQLRQELMDLNISAVIFDPSTSFKVSMMGEEADRRDAFIEAVNRNALELSDVMVVVLPAGVQSIGTSIELDMAYNHGKPIFLVTDIARGKSVYLNNRVPKEFWIKTTTNVMTGVDEDGLDKAIHTVAERVAKQHMAQDVASAIRAALKLNGVAQPTTDGRKND